MPENEEPENRDINVRDGNYIESLGGNYVQGNFIQNIINSLGGQSIAPVGNPQRERNQRLLLADVKQEVTARLKQSLHQAVLINLSKELQPQQVKRIWDAEIKIGEQLIEAISNTTTILEVFEQEEIAGKLLILGAPGSGKTTTQLELAQALITRAEEQQDYPIPVLLNLSSWRDENQSMADWLIAELKSKYGVSVKLGKEWVANRVILPLLDGLDEVKLILQKSCLQRINQFLEGEHRPQYIVICSRIEEYKNHQNKLLLNGAIYLKSLTNSQIHDYLIKVNHADFWQTINADPDLMGLVKTPLLLSITILASQEIYSEQWQQLVYASDRLQHLLDAYVRRMLTRPIESRVYIKRYPPTLRRTRIWLVVLAKMLQTELQTEFLIEKMQPSWLRNSSQRWMYSLSVMLLVVLIFTLNLGLSFVLFCLCFLSLTSGWSDLIFHPFFVTSDLIISWAYLPFFTSIFTNHNLDYILIYLIVNVTFLWQISSLIFAVIFGFYCGNNSKIITKELEVANQLCEWLGYLPLGLELVGRYVEKKPPNYKLAQMLQQLKEQRLDNVALNRKQQELQQTLSTAQQGVLAAFELSWLELSPATQGVAALLSLFAPNIFAWEWVESASELLNWSSADVETANEQLYGFHLIQWVEDFVRIHPLIREFLLVKLAASEQADDLKRGFAEVMVAIAKKIPQSPTQELIMRVKDAIPHLAEVAQNLIDAVSDENLIGVFFGLDQFYSGQGLYAFAQPWLEQCVPVVQTRLGDEHPDVATSYNNLAELYRHQGRYSEAEPLHIKALELRRRLLTEEHSDVATSYSHLAYLYVSQGRYSEAEPLHIKALELRRRLLTFIASRCCYQL